MSRPLADTVDIPAADTTVGPLLLMRAADRDFISLAALVITPVEQRPARLRAPLRSVKPLVLARLAGVAIWRFDFRLSARSDAGYYYGDHWYPVRADLTSDLDLAFVACNGREQGDTRRDLSERNALWRHLAALHRDSPLHLLLHGGDQLYADELLSLDPVLRAWADPDAPLPAADEIPADLDRQMLAYMVRRYCDLYRQPGIAALISRVPSLMMWDDHDICDGWGSLPAERLDHPVGRLVFSVARRAFCLFQLGADPDQPLPTPMWDAGGDHVGLGVALPGVAIVAPDLRSQRRPDRVLAPSGWQALTRSLTATTAERVLVLSSVPGLGPRLSGVETLLGLWPGSQKYEDDLRDQWQSRAHREEWRRFLELLLAVHERDDQRVTLLSGEIHLATRGELAASTVPLHQLVASGIAHPPPPTSYARALGALARLGSSPLPGHPIRMRPVPGQRRIYCNQRNYLLLRRRERAWSARWQLEYDGLSPLLGLD